MVSEEEVAATTRADVEPVHREPLVALCLSQ